MPVASTLVTVTTAADEQLAADTVTAGAVGAANWASLSKVKLDEVAVHVAAFAAVIVYDVPSVPPVTIPVVVLIVKSFGVEV